MKNYISKDDDLELLALLVDRELRQEYDFDASPSLRDYSLVSHNRASVPSADLHVRVGLGTGLRASIYVSGWPQEDREVDELVQLAGEISASIAALVDDASNVRAMLKEVTTATKREIVKARRQGLTYRLSSVELTPVEAGSGEERCVRVEHTALGRSLQDGEAFAFQATCSEDVTAAFAGIHDVQIERAARREQLASIGAAGTIDAVTVSALVDAGFNVPELLTRLVSADDLYLGCDSDKEDRFFLYWSEGTVFANLRLAEGVRWREDRLSFESAPEGIERLTVGSPLNGLYDHPFLDERLSVRSKHGRTGERATLQCNRALLAFDATTGRLWPV